MDASATTTRAVDVLLVAYMSLDSGEKLELQQRIADERLLAQAADDSEMARNIRSLRRVAEVVGREPSVDDYRDVSRELIARGEDIEPFKRLYAYFGTWYRAREAFTLSGALPAGRIEARFRTRQLGKVARYTDETLRETLLRCADEYGRAPGVNELERWRRREIELAAAAGNKHVQLPSATPYRRRFGSWEAALRHFGLSDEQMERRLER